MRRVWETGEAEPAARISFATPELMRDTLTAQRWAILRAMVGQGTLTIREIARRVGRDIKPVHADVLALLEEGILDRSARGQAELSYEAVLLDFSFPAA